MKAKNPYVPKIRKVYICFFYQQCMLCGLEFKKTHMWKYSYKDTWDTISKYLCESCAAQHDNNIAKTMMDDADYETYRKAYQKLLELKNG